MEGAKGFSSDVLVKEISKDGVNLTIIAKKAADDERQLAVRNETGVSSNWLKIFPSAQSAIEAGFKAIDEEGVRPFVDDEGFDY